MTMKDSMIRQLLRVYGQAAVILFLVSVFYTSVIAHQAMDLRLDDLFAFAASLGLLPVLALKLWTQSKNPGA